MKGYMWRPPQKLKEQLQQIAKNMGIPLSNLLILICRNYLATTKEEYESQKE